MPTSSLSRRLAVAILLAASLLPGGAGLLAALFAGLDFQVMERVLQTPGIERALWSSLTTGVVATLISLLLAHLVVALITTPNKRRRADYVILPVLAMPHLAVAIGLALVLTPSGLLLRLFSPWATGFELPPDWHIVGDPAGITLMLGLVLKETCFLVLALTAAQAQVPVSRLLLQAQTLGYGALKARLTVIAPLLQRQIQLPLLAVLVFGMTNVEMAIPLGPDLPPTFAVQLWRWFIDPDPMTQAQAYAGTLLLLVCVLA